ncbi:MAG: hypothetical protein OXT70_14015 [Chloroflexota bacterium]|nr:hypothetical protein [Chloroflexota bacterium]
MRFRLPGLLDARSWPLSLRAFLLGFTLVAVAVAIIGAVATPWPSGIPETLRVQVEASGEARGRYLAQQEAKQNAIDEARQQAAAKIADLVAVGSFDSGYQPTYRYAWNDVIEQLSRQVPRQRLHEEQHTQWIELLR